MDTDAASFRDLPQVQRLLEEWEGPNVPRPALIAALRAALDDARAGIRAGSPAPDGPALRRYAAAALAAAARPALRRVINATGIALHTNLGRAPLPEAAASAVAAVAAGYCNLEYDLDSGIRGSRTQGIEPLLTAITGAEAALAVNNCAAAVLLSLSALAGGGEVIVSRGELVEIGGGFRIPDVIQQGGARLVEVGATNRTRLADYAAAITPATRLLLKVHPSNFRVVGFTEAVEVDELAGLAREHGLLVMDDQGSGDLADVRRSLKAGADLVAFSGDKALGGPQAGLIVGSAAALAPLRQHPLLRAVRLDKLSLAALEATLRLHRDGAETPVSRMLAQTPATLMARAQRLCTLLDGIPAPSTAYAGAGTRPGDEIASVAVAVTSPLAPDELARRLRQHDPAVVGRVTEGRLWLDMLAVTDDEVPALAEAVRHAHR